MAGAIGAKLLHPVARGLCRTCPGISYGKLPLTIDHISLRTGASISLHHHLLCKNHSTSDKDDTPVSGPKKHPSVEEYKSAGQILNEEFKQMLNRDKDGDNKTSKIPKETDVLIIGGGAIGLVTAVMLKDWHPEAFSVTVIERDPTYSRASTTLSVGGIRQQFSLKENIEMSLYGAEFMRDLHNSLAVTGQDPPDIQFNHQGYLFLASEESVDVLKENHSTQTSLGAKVDLMDKSQLSTKFPWLNLSGIEMGSYGIANEGWFDPWLYLAALKAKCVSLGVHFVKGELENFILKASTLPHLVQDDNTFVKRGALDFATIKDDKGEIHNIRFSLCVNAAGPWAGEVALKAGIGAAENGPLSVPLPVEPRKRYVYLVHCPDGPGLEMPMLVDSSGVYCRREGLGGNYICGASPTEEDGEPDISNLEVDSEYFFDKVWPGLAKRVPAFECLKDQDSTTRQDVNPNFFKDHVHPILSDRIPVFQNLELKSSWAGYYDYNYFDENLVIGNHPYYRNFYFANGSSGHGIQHSPAIGRALTELILDSDYTSIDLSRFSFDRIMEHEPVFETNIV